MQLLVCVLLVGVYHHLTYLLMFVSQSKPEGQKIVIEVISIIVYILAVVTAFRGI